MTSMGGTSIFGWMEKNHFDNEAARFLLKRAENNVGLILPGIAPIRDILFGSWIYNGQKKYDSLKKFTEEFHKTGAKIFIQLTAGFGRSLAINKLMIDALHSKPLRTLIKPILDVDYLTASASATPNRWDDSCISRPLTKAEINAMVEAAVKDGRIKAEAKETWVNLASKDFDLAKTTLDAISPVDNISSQINNDPANIQAAQQGRKSEEEKAEERVLAVVGKDFKYRTPGF